MAGVTASISLKIEAKQTRAADFGEPVFQPIVSERWSFQPGTASGQADEIFSDERTIAASSNEDLDLAGALTNAFGVTLTIADVAAIYIKADSGNTNNVVFGPAASNGFLGPFGHASDRLSLAPGQGFLMTAPAAGWAVTAGTGDKINVANSGSGTGVTYKIMIIGRTA